MIEAMIQYMITIELAVPSLDISCNGGSTYRSSQVLYLNYVSSQETTMYLQADNYHNLRHCQLINEMY